MRNLPIEPSKSEIQPWHSLGGIEHICELRKSCIVLYGIFTEILRMIYNNRDGRLIGTPDIIWTQKGTSLWIDSELHWEDEHPEVRPAIYVMLKDMQYQPFIPGLNSKIAGANRFGARHYEQKVSGQVVFMHVASTTGEACSLADNTDYELTMLQDPICRDFCFTNFYSIGRSPLSKLPKEANDKFASGVVFNYEYIDSWDVHQESPILKSIDLIESDSEEKFSHTDLSAPKIDKSSRQRTVNSDNIFTENKGSEPSSSK